MQRSVYTATVVGAGPAGLAILGRLLTAKFNDILWIDPAFEGGKLNEYQKVPANTRTSFFIRFMSECPAYDTFLQDKDPSLSPLEVFKGLDPNVPPVLSHAYKMCKSLTKNVELKHKNQVITLRSSVNDLLFKEKENVWEVTTNDNKKYLTERVLLAVGSRPRNLPGNTKAVVPLDALVNDDPEELSKFVGPNDVVGVIGSSHSSILALKHLEQLPAPPKAIHCFYREPIRYAVHTDKGIVYDNLGLKGQAAGWAKNHLEAGKSKLIQMHWMKDEQTEKEIYKKFFDQCNKLAVTIGFERNPLPTIRLQSSGGAVRNVEKITYDGTDLRILDGVNSTVPLKNMWGIGIAFPRQLRDLSGDMGNDVGIFKFGNAAKVIIEQITGTPPAAKL
jgi:hypothetical protein